MDPNIQPLPFTPHTVPQGCITGPLLHVVLLDRVVGREEISDLLAEKFGSRLSNVNISEGSAAVAAELDGKYLLHVTVLDQPPADPSTTYCFHPVLSGDPSGLERVEAQVLVALLPSNEALLAVQQFREPRAEQLIAHAQVTAVVAALRGVQAVHAVAPGVTVSPGIFVEGVTKQFWSQAVVSVWVAQEDAGLSAYTVGLASAGHPELVIRGSQWDPSKLYYRMCDIAEYVVAGQTLREGDTFAFSPDVPESAAPVIVSTEYPLGGGVPALLLDY